MNIAAQSVDALTLSVAAHKDEPELTKLLEDSYRLSPDFTVHDETYFQDHFSGRGAVLIARSEGQLIGTMRANLISCSADVNCEDEGMLADALVPALFLSRAATVRDNRAKGVNSMMRLYCIEAALELGLKSMVGFIYQSAPRTRLMAELGYVFIPFTARSTAVFTDHSLQLFASLCLKKSGETALAYLRSRLGEQGCQMTWDGGSVSDALLTREW